MSDFKTGIKTTRRDFLASVAGSTLAAGLPWLPKAAFAKTTAQQAPAGAEIAHLRIYPALGISRVGGSAQWFLAPEVPGLPPEPNNDYKDGEQKIKKQVQRFRIYAFDSQDRVICELTAADA